MPRWLPRLLSRIRELASRGQVRFTLKALGELAALDAGLDVQDACDVLAALTITEFATRLKSEATSECMYVFKPIIAGTVVYLKLLVRSDCVVVSFHEDEAETDEEP